MLQFLIFQSVHSGKRVSDLVWYSSRLELIRVNWKRIDGQFWDRES